VVVVVGLEVVVGNVVVVVEPGLTSNSVVPATLTSSVATATLANSRERCIRRG
jgi:hypothetical protein